MLMTDKRAAEMVEAAKAARRAAWDAWHVAKARGHNRKAARLLNLAIEAQDAVDAAEKLALVFHGEVGRRQFPKALRPTHVYRADGGHMPYDKWMALLPNADAIVGMMFEDGIAVGSING